MKVQAITLRKGHALDRDGKLWLVTHYEIMQPGKGASVIQVEMRALKGGNKDNVRYRTQETVERVRLEQHEYQFMYKDSEGYHFMNQTTYDQVNIAGEIIGYSANFLQEGMICTVESFEGEPLSVEIPQYVTMLITEADPVVKGQTASSSYKPAVLENGVKIQVPPFIGSGTRVVIKTEDGSYVERAKD
jgi:elongation factor P